jgi:ATP-dependent DNA helicase DinG
MVTAEHPLTHEEKHLIAAAYRQLAIEILGYALRDQQKDLIQFTARAFAAEVTGVGQAPTGTGKTHGYLIPGIVLALTRDRRLIISTETANLQDQIYQRDLAVMHRVFEALGYSFKAVVAKGRERYICPLRLEEHASQGSLMDGDQVGQAIQELSRKWSGGQWDGVRDSLIQKVPGAIWMKVNNNRYVCSNDRCPVAPECPHMNVKASLKEARVIVTNHSYLLSMIAATNGAEGGKRNPVVDFEKNFYAFDEAHHLNDRLIESFASNATLDEGFLPELSATLSHLRSSNTSILKIRGEALKGIGAALRHNAQLLLNGKDMHRFTLGEVPGTLQKLTNEYADNVENIISLLDEAIESASKEPNPRPALLVSIGHANEIRGKLEEKLEALADFTSQKTTAGARWIDRKKGEVSVHAAPFEAASIGHRVLWKHLKGAVLTSATFKVMGSFDSALRALGLPVEETPTISLSSPLDYSRSRMVVPRHIADVNSPGHTAQLVQYIRTLAFKEDQQGSLIYFTSRKKMEAVYAGMTEEERGFIILQSGQSASVMVEEHRRRIDAGQRSILFGTNSLSEGVDLPLHYCTLVMIDKLPFPPPDDPIMASHAEHLESKGLSPFHLITLPAAAKKLAQVSGRLNRTEADWGSVWVMDSRLVEKSYGAQLLKSTPFREVARM